MNRLALLIACFAVSAANTCLAQAPAACTSACASEQRACHADAQNQPTPERFMRGSETGDGALVKTRQGTFRNGSLATAASLGAGDRILAASAGCDSRYKACTQSCAQPQGAGARGAVVKPEA